MPQLRAIIIDDDRNRRETIRQNLPDYIEGVTVGYGESAIEKIKPDENNETPDVVILYGDDAKSYGLYIFDWMLNKSNNDEIASIPVIVLTDDEFSDRCMEFLEIGDATFFDGDIEGDDLFSVITQVLEEADFRPEPVEPVYEETKNIDRLMGKSVKAPGEDGKQRAVVLDMDSRIENLEAALARGRQRVEDIRMILDAAQKLKDDDSIRRKRGPSPKGSKTETNTERTSTFLKKAREKVEASTDAGTKDTTAKENAASVDVLKQKAISNPFGAFNAQGTVRMEERPAYAKPSTGEKRTVVIVDDDLKTRKLCSLFLTQKYNVLTFDSGMKTIDFFVKNRADLLIINPVLSGMSGVATVSSVWNQPGGAGIFVMYLVDEKYTQPRTTLLGKNVAGILNKPIKQGVLAQAVDGYFENIR